jgi:hypothetical protein
MRPNFGFNLELGSGERVNGSPTCWCQMLRPIAGAGYVVLCCALLFRALSCVAAPDGSEAPLQERFADAVHPFISAYCVKCHSGEKPKGQLDLQPYASLSAVTRDFSRWATVREKLVAKEMPPDDAPSHPTDEARQAVVEWIDAVHDFELQQHGGDPGVVLARRLSNAEYNYTIRDLTGVDIRPTREFPVDPTNPAGFDNSGESLAMSPELMKKYLQAAHEVADHLVLKPEGFAFAPYPMLVETDRDKYCVQRIVNFYHRFDTDYADYFQAAWRYKNCKALARQQATLAGTAAECKVSPVYLATIWSALEEKPESIGPLAKLQTMWRDLPQPHGNDADAAWAGCVQMRDYVVQLRKKLEPRFPNLAAGKVAANSQPLLMWKNRQYASHRLTFDPKALQMAGEVPPREEQVAAAEPEPGADNEFGPGHTAPVKNKPGDPDLAVPPGLRAEYEAAFGKFCSIFPDAFYIQERGRNYFDTTKDKGRLLSAGFHNLMGYFRDDLPLYQLMLDEKQQRELDELWQELDFVASGNIRTYVQFYLNESGEARVAGGKSSVENSAAEKSGADGRVNTGTADASDSKPHDASADDRDIISAVRIQQVADHYAARARGGSEVALQAIKDHFQWVNASIRATEKARLEAERSHLQALVDFASRAYRRRLSAAERNDLLAFYHQLRDKSGLDHESAMRDCIVSVLMSPDFCYRLDLADPSPGVHPIADDELASRLSYFLWSSMPDEKLLAHAAVGDLRDEAVIAAEAKRMLTDSRTRALAVEFGGNWLDFRRFEEINTVDRDRFPTFTSELREAMFEEPVRFLLDVFQNNRPILDCLYARDTFVNGVLAKHYGMPLPSGSQWVHMADADQYARGGLLAMGAFLTKNAPGLRTSPVKRGYWVVKNVLGERIPPPPAVVPELPRDEAKLDLPLRDVLAHHRRDASCAACHSRFDSMGLVFEGYGPLGERRDQDLAGHPVDAHATFPAGSEGEGLEGLRQYIKERREADFVDNFCRKLLAYALGRSLMLSDDVTIAEMHRQLAGHDYRFENIIESIVTCPQFLSKRGREQTVSKGEGDEAKTKFGP